MNLGDLKATILRKIKQIARLNIKEGANDESLQPEVPLVKLENAKKSLTLKVDMYGKIRFVTQEQSPNDLSRTWICISEAELGPVAYSIINLKSEIELRADLERLRA